jgi:hypothetical protein
MRKTKKTMELEFQEYSEIPSNNVMGQKKISLFILVHTIYWLLVCFTILLNNVFA